MTSPLVLLLTWVFFFYQVSEVHSGIKRPPPGWNTSGFTQPTPQFEATASSILAHVGQNITLPCRVRNLAEQVVSWIRTSELSILTSNVFTFTSDPRFSVDHPLGDSAAWGLRVTGVRLEDGGEYECQVSTFPKLRHTVRLTVKDVSMNSDGFEENVLRDGPPSSDLTDVLQLKPSHQALPLGSVSSLTCTAALDDDTLASSDEKDLPLIRWRHNGTALNIRNHSRAGARSRYSVESEVSADRILSRLVISGLEYGDAGVYECALSGETAESVLLVSEDMSEALAVNAASTMKEGVRVPVFCFSVFLFTVSLSEYRFLLNNK